MQDEMGYQFVLELKEYIPFRIIYGYQGNSINYVRDHFYNECFVNLKPNIVGGFTTAQELAYMGRKTISNSKASFCIPYKNVKEAARAVMEEAKKIGTIQPSCIGDYFNIDKEWKQVAFWK
jgi:hypothetical protein